MTDDQMQNDKLCVYMTHTEKGCKWNDMPIHIYYLYLACLPLLFLANDIIYDNLYDANVFQNTHIAAYGRTHMHTPP